MMASRIKGAATSPANQGGTSGPRGESNGHPRHQSQLLFSDDAPSGADGKTKGRGIRLTQSVRLGTWNVRTLLQSGLLTLLLREMHRCRVQLLGIAEMRLSGKGHFTSDDGCTVYYSGNDKGGSNGVAFIANSSISKHVLGYNPVSDRIITIRLQARPMNISLVQVYAPTSTAANDDIDNFYNQLQDVMDSLPKNDVVLVIGDFNAKIGKGILHDVESKAIGKYGLGTRNERGDLLIDFCIENNLCITNTLFSQHPRRLYTWQGPGGMVRNQIDYITIKNRWKSSIKVTKTLPGADVGSDHQLLFAELRIKLKTIAKAQRPMRFDLMNISKQFWTETNNRYEALLIHEAKMTPDELWADIKGTILDVTKEHVPVKRKNKASPWLSQEVIDLADERRQLKEAGLQASNLYRKLTRSNKSLGEINLTNLRTSAANLKATALKTIAEICFEA